MKYLRRILPVLTVLLLLCVPSAAHAQADGSTISDFSADYFLSQDDPQGTMEVRERIRIDLSGEKHGILRALPERYNGQSLHVKITQVQRAGNTEPYETYHENGNLVLKIGNPKATITGPQAYAIDYRVENVLRFEGTRSWLTWNVNGTQWKQPAARVQARLHVSTALAKQMGDVGCFAGSFGSTTANCQISRGTKTTIIAATMPLQAGETLTYQVDFAAGTFTAPTFRDWWHDHQWLVLQTAVPPLVALVFVYRYWRKHGKDLPGRGTIVPEYSPPDDLRAAEADVVNNYKLGTNAISATIIDLAIRKYLKIVETRTDGVLGLGKRTTYSFEQLPGTDTKQLKPYERQVLQGLFPAGTVTAVDSLKTSFHTTAAAVKKDLPAQLTTAGYFPRNPSTAGRRLWVVGFVLVGVGWLLAQFLSFGLVLAGLVVLGFALLMPRRTQKGVDTKDKLAGLKLYMETAEKDRIAMLQSPGAPYAPQTDEPVKTVELFEKLLPFAIILGVEKGWAKQFESIYTTPPDWYGGNWATFNAAYLVGSLEGSVSAMNGSFAAPSTSGAGSGSSFAGGGGGGGGGGTW
jgi:uncharacterized membrane protein YgcG